MPREAVDDGRLVRVALGRRVAVRGVLGEGVVEEEHVRADARDVRVGAHARVVLEAARVQVADERRDARAHAALARERHVRQAVADEALKHGDAEAEVRLEAEDGRRGPQLLVVADEDEVLHAAREAREEVRLEDLGG